MKRRLFARSSAIDTNSVFTPPPHPDHRYNGGGVSTLSREHRRHWGRLSICVWVTTVFVLFPFVRRHRKNRGQTMNGSLSPQPLQPHEDAMQSMLKFHQKETRETWPQQQQQDAMQELRSAQNETGNAATDFSTNHPVSQFASPPRFPTTTTSACAICFFGLPRSFESLVLPSIVQNILQPNQKRTRCDIFLHYYDIKVEKQSRSSQGGTLDTDQVYLLNDAVDKLNRRSLTNTHVSIVKDTEESFQQQRGQQLEKYMTIKASDGKPLYFPWMAKSYDKASVQNIIKQWHSISEVWRHMEETAVQLHKNYTRVAMMRNDVVYVTPFDIHQISNTTRDVHNNQVIVPNWARFPINDRMVYGPYEAVKVWATERFDRLETHVLTYEPGYGLHSERFLNHSIFGAIRDELHYDVTTNPEICFFRARADGTVWINDCATRDGAAIGFRNLDHAQSLVEELVGHACVRGKYKQRIIQVDCSINSPAGGKDNVTTS